LYSILVKRIGDKKALFIYTDGGADHRLTFVSVQLALIALFLNLNLDFICASRTCPYHSWRNPVECIMSTINLGCQCVGLMREEGPAQFEAAIKNANNLGQLQKNALHFKDEAKTTLNQPTVVKLGTIASALRSVVLMVARYASQCPCNWMCLVNYIFYLIQ